MILNIFKYEPSFFSWAFFFPFFKRNRRRTSDGRSHLFRSRWMIGGDLAVVLTLGEHVLGGKRPSVFLSFWNPGATPWRYLLCTVMYLYLNMDCIYIYITYLLIWIAHIYIYIFIHIYIIFIHIYIYIYIYTHVMDVWYRNCTLLLQRFRLPLSKGAEIIEQSTYLPATHLPS